MKTHVHRLLGTLLLAVAFLFLQAQNGAAYSIKTFSGPDGSSPKSDLVLAGDTLYGVTIGGGNLGSGTVFKVNLDGSGFAVLYHFNNYPDGRMPIGGLTLSGDTLYGSTYWGGYGGGGTIFRINTNGSDFTVLKHVIGARSVDDCGPPYVSLAGSSIIGRLTVSGNTLYGMTSIGGNSGGGTLFRMNTNGSAFTNLYTFLNKPNVFPAFFTGPGVIVTNDVIYGVTAKSGNGKGMVFRVNTDGSNFSALHSFAGGSSPVNGANPNGTLLQAGNTLYGTAAFGGTYNNGVVFKIDTNGTNYTVLHRFESSIPASGVYRYDTNVDGSCPMAGLTLVNDTLYGTTYIGGHWVRGTVFALKTNGSDFRTITHVLPGNYPSAGVVLSGSNLYGATTEGGAYQLGVIYKVPTNTVDIQTDAQQTAGTYNGLFSDPRGVAQCSAGFFTIKLKTTRTFSGRMLVDGDSMGFVGVFDPAGYGVTKPIARKGKPPLVAQFCLATNGTLGGFVNPDEGDWIADMAGDKVVFDLANPATDFAGVYTMAVPFATNSAAPQGYGYAAVTISTRGTVRVGGYLGDGTPFTDQTPVAKDGSLPLYVPVYRGVRTYTNANGAPVTTKEYKGSIMGWLHFSGDNHAPTGGVFWTKPPVLDSAYHSCGFTNDVDILGSRYAPPPPGAPGLNLTGDGMLVSMQGNLDQPLVNPVADFANYQFLFPAPNANAQTLNLKAKTGVLTGRFFHPNHPTGVTKTRGIVLQDQNIGCGFFLGTNQSGSIWLQPD